MPILGAELIARIDVSNGNVVKFIDESWKKWIM
jgi:hypothetical protein